MFCHRTHPRSIRRSADNHSKLSAAKVSSDDDLLTEILFRLPVRSLLVFKSVSKRWLSLISAPYFIKNHYLHNYPSVSAVFLQQGAFHIHPEYKFIPLNKNIIKAPFKSLTFPPDHTHTRILQSCNGLLFCLSYRTNSNQCSFYIYNPSTKCYKSLPLTRGINEATTICCGSLAFDPLKSSHYKVVCMWKTDISSAKYQIEIYDSEKGSWKRSGDAVTSSNVLLTQPGVFWNGFLNWIIPGVSSLCFDVNKEILSTMPVPTIPKGQIDRKLEYFGATRDRIHLIERYDDKNLLYLHELESDYSRWNVKHRVNLDDVAISYPEILQDFDLSRWYRYAFYIILVQDGDQSSLILSLQNKIISYNLKAHTFKKLQDITQCVDSYLDILIYTMFDSFQYIQTLACV